MNNGILHEFDLQRSKLNGYPVNLLPRNRPAAGAGRKSLKRKRRTKIKKKSGAGAISIPKPYRQSQTCYFLIRGAPISDRPAPIGPSSILTRPTASTEPSNRRAGW